MSDDLASLKMLVVSGVAAESQIVCRAASEASSPVAVKELDAAADAAATCKLLSVEAFDVICFDSRMPKEARLKVIEAARVAVNRPLAILIGPAEMRTRRVLTEGLVVDGVLAKPIELQEVRDLVANCIRARSPSRVLIVDDSSTVRSVVRKVLQASRYRLELEEAADGEAAIDRARRQSCDIVFLDCHMPGMDGFQVLNDFKHNHPDTKVVMITGMRDGQIENRARAEGAKDFLYKPFFAKDIDAVLNRLFGLMRPMWN